MKNLLLLLLVTISIFSCQKEGKPTYVIFNGSVENSNTDSAKISGHGFEKVIEITETGSFSDTLKIDKEGYYSLRIGRESTPVYLIQGANIGLTLNTKEFDESLVYTGDMAAENNYLAAKYLLSEKELAFDKVYSLPEDEFIKQINKINSSYSDLLNSSTGVSKDFIEKETKELEYAHINNMENYEQYYQYLTKDNSFKASQSLYDSFKEFNFADNDAYENSNAYKRLLESHYSRIARDASGNNKDIALAYLETVNNKFSNGATKDELMFNYLRYGMKANNDLEAVYNLYKNSNQNAENLSKVTSSYKVLSNLTPGKASPSFNYENFKGGKTSLEDLKGKVVYVDVWATWCGPCLREIPSLKTLEAEYHDKNIAFVSLSIDEKKDYDKWRTMITEKNLEGIQLMADKDWKSKFVTDYGIRGIPRFIIIDTKGNIVNSDAPRPSSTDIREVLNGLLM
jgi:thiol-disulfide isomerase/thioredoxin